MDQHAHPPLICDHAEAERFLSALDPSATGFTFQTFDDNADRKSPALTKIIHGTLQDCWSRLAELNQRGAGVFVTINRTDLKGRKRENIVAVRAVFVDLDGAPLDPIVNDTELPQPHIFVETSLGRWHAYWLTNDLTLDQFTQVQKALIDRFKSDPSRARPSARHAAAGLHSPQGQGWNRLATIPVAHCQHRYWCCTVFVRSAADGSARAS